MYQILLVNVKIFTLIYVPKFTNLWYSDYIHRHCTCMRLQLHCNNCIVQTMFCEMRHLKMTSVQHPLFPISHPCPHYPTLVPTIPPLSPLSHPCPHYPTIPYPTLVPTIPPSSPLSHPRPHYPTLVPTIPNTPLN